MSETELISERIAELMKKRDMSYGTLSEKTGIPKSALHRYANGTTPKIPIDRVQLIATALNSTPQYIMGWSEAADLPIAKNIVPVEQIRRIPLLSKIACGNPILATENIISYLPCPLNIHADYALTCQGDSMENANIYDGDIVFIKQQSTVENGEIAAVLFKGENEGTLKRFYQNGDTVVLQPENNKYQPIFVQSNDINNLLIQGKAVAVLHEL